MRFLRAIPYAAVLIATGALIGSQVGRAEQSYQVPCERSSIEATIKLDGKTFLLTEIEICPKGRIVLFGRYIKCKTVTKTVRHNGTVIMTSSIRCN